MKVDFRTVLVEPSKSLAFPVQLILIIPKEKAEQGLKNFTENIRPIMDKCRDREELNSDEQNTILQFYMEVVYVINLV